MGKTQGNQRAKTLRSLRHNAGSSASSSRSKGTSQKKHAVAGMTPRERLDKQSQKPLIKGRQFKFVSPAQRMRDMQVDMQRVRERRDMLEGEEDADGNEAHSLFGHALAQSQLNNLSLPFVAFYRKVESKSRSLPLVVHYRNDIVEAICLALRADQKDVELCGQTILE